MEEYYKWMPKARARCEDTQNPKDHNDSNRDMRRDEARAQMRWGVVHDARVTRLWNADMGRPLAVSLTNHHLVYFSNHQFASAPNYPPWPTIEPSWR